LAEPVVPVEPLVPVELLVEPLALEAPPVEPLDEAPLEPEVPADPEVPPEPLEPDDPPVLPDDDDEPIDMAVSQMPVWVSQTWSGPKQYPPMALQLGRQAPTSVASTGSQT